MKDMLLSMSAEEVVGLARKVLGEDDYGLDYPERQRLMTLEVLMAILVRLEAIEQKIDRAG